MNIFLLIVLGIVVYLIIAYFWVKYITCSGDDDAPPYEDNRSFLTKAGDVIFGVPIMFIIVLLM